MGSIGYANNQLVGLRVVRDLNWVFGTQDGGEGFVGTVVGIFDRHSEVDCVVIVSWDSGTIAHYPISQQINSGALRVLDNSTVGVKHTGVKCRVCCQKDIAGMRWQCLDCPTPFDLCTFCYTKHDQTHVNFKRYDRPSSVPVVVKDEKKIRLKGIFPGAQVERGVDWKYGDEDGRKDQQSDKTIGKVVSAPTGRKKEPGIVWVQWPHDKEPYPYCLGLNGKMDLRMAKAGFGGLYQPDTLPVLVFSKMTAVADPPFVIGDTVKFTVGLKELREMVTESSVAWNGGMKKVVNMVGTIMEIDPITNNYARVMFQEDIRNRALSWLPLKAMRRLIPWLPVGAVVQVIDESLSNESTSMSMPDDENEKDPEKEIKMASDFGRVKVVRPCGEKVMLEFLKPDGRVVIKPFLVNQLKIVDASREKMESIRRDLANLLLTEVKKGATLSVEYLMKNLGNMIACTNSRFNDTSCIALNAACEIGDMKMVKLLLEHKETWIDKEEGDELMECGLQPIQYSVYGNQPEVLQLLLEDGYNINHRDPNGDTPLHYAVALRQLECMRILLENQRCDPNLKNNNGDTPLKIAVKNSHLSVATLKIFHDNGKLNLTNKENEDIVYLATENNNIEAVKFLLSLPEGRKLAQNGCGDFIETALHASCRLGYNEIAKLLVEQLDKDEKGKPWGIDIQESKTKRTLLMEVIQKSNCELIETLIRAGANLHATDKKGDSAFHYAARLVHQKKLPAVNWPSRATSPDIFGIYTELKKKHNNEDLCVVTAIVLYIFDKGGIPQNLTFPEIKELIGNNFVYDEITEVFLDPYSIAQIVNSEGNPLQSSLTDDLNEINGVTEGNKVPQKKQESFRLNNIAHEKEVHHPDSAHSTQQRNNCDLSVPLSQSPNEVAVMTSQKDPSPPQDEMATGDSISPIPQHPPSPPSQQQSNVSGSISPIPNENVPVPVTPAGDTVANIIASVSVGEHLTPSNNNGSIPAAIDVPHLGETTNYQSVPNNYQKTTDISSVNSVPGHSRPPQEVTCTIEEKHFRKRKGGPAEDKTSWIIIDESGRRYSQQKKDVSDIFQCTANVSTPNKPNGSKKCKGTIDVQDLAGKVEEWKTNPGKKFMFTVRNAHEEHLPSKRGRKSPDKESDAPSTSNQKMDAPYMGETISSQGVSNDQPTVDTSNPVTAGSARPPDEVTLNNEEKQFRKRTRGDSKKKHGK